MIYETLALENRIVQCWWIYLHYVDLAPVGSDAIDACAVHSDTMFAYAEYTQGIGENWTLLTSTRVPTK